MLSDFKEFLDDETWAFRMDGGKEGHDKDMRKHVGLGTCHCCDFFRPLGEEHVVLIEETDLTTSKKNYQSEFARMSGNISLFDESAGSLDKNEEEYADNRVMWENQLKVYGSMLVLCRYATQCNEVATLMRGRKFYFSLVNTNERNLTYNEIDFEHWRLKLRNDFRSVLSKSMFEDIRVLHKSELVDWFLSDR